MPTWGECLRLVAERNTEMAGQGLPMDAADQLRGEYLMRMHELRGRSTILYQAHVDSINTPVPDAILVNRQDLEGFMEVLHQLPGNELDLILVSPGGSIEETISLLTYLRTKFDQIDVFVPSYAMSSATILCCGADKIWMGKHSFLGPIAPQNVNNNQNENARQALEQFEMIKTAFRENPEDREFFGLQAAAYFPSLLRLCENAIELSSETARTLSHRYMFRHVKEPRRSEKAEALSAFLSSFERFKSHSCTINRAEAREAGMVVEDLEGNDALRDTVLTIFHLANIAFSSRCCKIIQNHVGNAYITRYQFGITPIGGPAMKPRSSHDQIQCAATLMTNPPDGLLVQLSGPDCVANEQPFESWEQETAHILQQFHPPRDPSIESALPTYVSSVLVLVAELVADKGIIVRREITTIDGVTDNLKLYFKWKGPESFFRLLPQFNARLDELCQDPAFASIRRQISVILLPAPPEA